MAHKETRVQQQNKSEAWRLTQKYKNKMPPNQTEIQIEKVNVEQR